MSGGRARDVEQDSRLTRSGVSLGPIPSGSVQRAPQAALAVALLRHFNPHPANQLNIVSLDWRQELWLIERLKAALSNLAD